MKTTSLFSKNKTHFSLTNTYIFLLFLCKIPLFYTVSLSLITVYNFWMFYAFKTTLGGGGTILIIMWLMPLFWLLVIVEYWIHFEWNTAVCMYTCWIYSSRDLDTLLHKVEVITLEITLVFIQKSQWMRKCGNCTQEVIDTWGFK